MPTEINGYSPSEETALSSLVINEVDSNETFEKMKEKGILQDNQLYLVTDEQGGGTYYTAGEVDALLAGKAPAGYGLGTTAKKITDWNNANVGEWCTADPGAANSPDESHGWFGITYASWTTDVFIQDAFALVNVDKYYHRRRMYYPVEGAGTPWEWIDPPFDDINTVYRTTERHLGNPVYKKMDSNGVIWWSTDQSTWKCEAERVGAYSKAETDTLLQKKVNPNLLDNWYFLNPVNQRGVTSGKTTPDVYFIDRWLTIYGSSGAGTYSLDTDGITLTPYANDSCSIFQRFENVNDLDGKVLTASVLLSNGELFSGTITRVNGKLQWFYLNGNKISLYMNSNNTFSIGVYINPLTITAAKLELGTQQTLAHQENGNWVLNEIPNYQQELAKCQRYYQRIKGYGNVYSNFGSGYFDSSTDAAFFVPINAPMRTIPSVSYSSPDSFKVITTSKNFDPTAMSVNTVTISTTGFKLVATVSGATAGQGCILQANSTAEAFIELLADL